MPTEASVKVKSSIRLPVSYELSDYTDDRFKKVKIWIAHTGENLNYSVFSKEALEKMAKKYEAKVAKAQKEARISLAKEMLADNECIDKVVKYSKLSVKEVRALAAKMSA